MSVIGAVLYAFFPKEGPDRARTKRENDNAGESNIGTGATRSSARQSGIDASGRICSRGDPSHSRGQTRGQVCEAGNRDRVVKSATRRREFAGAKERAHVGENATQRYECSAKRTPSSTGVTESLSGAIESVAASRSRRGVASVAFEAGEISGKETTAIVGQSQAADFPRIGGCGRSVALWPIPGS